MRPRARRFFANAGRDRRQREKIEGRRVLECELEIEVRLSWDD